MATKNEDQTKYSHLSKVLENVQKKSTYFREIPEGEKVCCKENSERCHSRMSVNIIFFICLYYSVAFYF
jgi:hypothetical protein